MCVCLLCSQSSAARNSAAMAQGAGSEKRDTFLAKTNLDVTFMRTLPGYTGHLASNTSAAASVAPRPTGVFAPTESAASSGMVSAYWEARKAK